MNAGSGCKICTKKGAVGAPLGVTSPFQQGATALPEYTRQYKMNPSREYDALPCGAIHSRRSALPLTA